VTLEGITAGCVYKPVRGERPLWDFPDGTLAGREVAAYLLSEATGWAVEMNSWITARRMSRWRSASSGKLTRSWLFSVKLALSL
jgi:hypothetical protein